MYLEIINEMQAEQINFLKSKLDRSDNLTEDLVREKEIRTKVEVNSKEWKPIPGYTPTRERIRLAELKSREEALKSEKEDETPVQ